MRKSLGILLSTLLSLSLFSCITEDSVSTGSGSTRLNVRLTDSPGDYEEVNVDIRGMRVNMTSNENEKDWIEIENFNSGIYNLLELTGGVDTLLASNEIPAGKIYQIRLILGTENSVKVKGKLYPLQTPSAQQSGLKLKVNAQIQEGLHYNMLLDFDAARSVVQAGKSGKYILKPTITVITELASGSIKGIVKPAEAHPAIWAIAGADTIAGTYASESGEFLLRGLSENTYKVIFKPAGGFKDLTLEGIEVSMGQIIDLGEVEIETEEEEEEDGDDDGDEEEDSSTDGPSEEE